MDSEKRDAWKKRCALFKRNLGKILRAQRQGREGLTRLRQLAEKSGMSLGYLSEVELGKNAASIETLLKIADTFQRPLWQLIREAELLTPDVAPSAAGGESELDGILTRISGLVEQARQLIRETA
jgi:transcriptional regulator with XRE-family HTH domain